MANFYPEGSGQLEQKSLDQLIFITGMQGSGKTSVARRALQETHSLLDMGPTMKRIHAATAYGISYEQWLAVHESDDILFVPKLIADEAKAESQNSSLLGIIGARSMRVIETIQHTLQPKISAIVYIDAPYDIRKHRYQKRTGYQVTMSFETAEEYNRKLGTHLIMAAADVIVDNSGTFEDTIDLLSGKLQLIVGKTQ